MGRGDADTEVEVAVLEERVKNLCGKVEGMLRRCERHSVAHNTVTKELSDKMIRLESDIHFLNDEIETTKTLEGASEKGIEIKFLYEVIRLLGVVILILFGEYVKKGM